MENFPILKRKKVSNKNQYTDYREFLREEFFYSCAYCSMTEVEAQGIGFDIDHFKPWSRFPESKNDYYNLLWSCKVCNRLKSDYYPNTEQAKKKLFILRPDKDIFEDHFSLNNNLLHSETITGKFTEVQLSLNRQALRRLRSIRKGKFNSDQYIAHGVSRLKNLRLDNLPAEVKGDAFRLRAKLLGNAQKTPIMTDELIKAMARSRLLDPEENHSEHMKSRRALLKKLKAI
ncbi:HNH endonuclease [Leptolyngbyaceae cyanobacterium CCMR0082]|uniref:HNH endonuclease n=1 Tax=Adonisia turfae CCMR0082 TaxID=2304604 RepID=A0A6M0SAW4_9CYAN|nr:HNH endonuclease signature motif containing protein [Adonisia turfae]NEZ64832.1 HNH endonuclease [Adonisia turfae CCMR0082]